MSQQQGELLVLSEEQIREFLENGVLVIPNVLSAEEVMEARAGMAATLKKHASVDVNDLVGTAHGLKLLSTTGGAGGVLDVFYEDWKLKVNEKEKIAQVMGDLWSRTFAIQCVNFQSPFGAFNPRQPLMYIDRIGFRVPEAIATIHGESKKKKLQRSLTPHFDCNPHNMYETGKDTPKWRPIQAFIALSDTLNADEGGFECCPGHHIGFDEWARNRIGTKIVGKDGIEKVFPPPTHGDFSPVRPIEDKAILDKIRHIPCRAGDMVCWDNRIPHANARFNNKSLAREVIYLGLLPNIERNRLYVQAHLEKYRQGIVPTDQWHESTKREDCSYEFSNLGKKMMMIEPWGNS